MKKLMSTPTPLQRFVEIMSRLFWSALQRIAHRYDGVVLRIWADKPRAQRLSSGFLSSTASVRRSRTCAPLTVERTGGPVIEEGGQDLELQIDKALKQACLDVAARARHAAANQRGKHALHDRAASQHVGNSQADWNRTQDRLAVEPHHAGAGLGEQVLSGPPHPRPLFAISRDAGINDPRSPRRSA